MSKTSNSRSNIFKRKVPMWLLFVLTGTVAGIMFLFNITLRKKTPALVTAAVAAPAVNCDFTVHQQRLKDYRFTSPLLFVDINNESEKLNVLKSSIETIIDEQKKEGKINSASV